MSSISSLFFVPTSPFRWLSRWIHKTKAVIVYSCLCGRTKVTVAWRRGGGKQWEVWKVKLRTRNGIQRRDGPVINLLPLISKPAIYHPLLWWWSSTLLKHFPLQRTWITVDIAGGEQWGWEGIAGGRAPLSASEGCWFVSCLLLSHMCEAKSVALFPSHFPGTLTLCQVCSPGPFPGGHLCVDLSRWATCTPGLMVPCGERAPHRTPSVCPSPAPSSHAPESVSCLLGSEATERTYSPSSRGNYALTSGEVYIIVLGKGLLFEVCTFCRYSFSVLGDSLVFFSYL